MRLRRAARRRAEDTALWAPWDLPLHLVDDWGTLGVVGAVLVVLAALVLFVMFAGGHS